MSIKNGEDVLVVYVTQQSKSNCFLAKIEKKFDLIQSKSFLIYYLNWNKMLCNEDKKRGK